MLAIEDLPHPARERVVAADAARALQLFVDEAARAHPDLAFSPAAFAVHALSHVPPDAVLAQHLGTMRPGDLLVAYACASGDARAIAIFEQKCFPEIPFAHARVRPRMTVDEVAQAMRERLFVRVPGAEPKVIQYSGAGELRAWFRVVLVRQLLNTLGAVKREVELEDAMVEALPDGHTDPEIEHARRLYGPALKRAVAAAISALEPRERTLLRLAVCDGLTVDAIGAIYGVHRATAARWVSAARDALQVGTRERLRAELHARDDSIASLLRLLASHVDLSLGGQLRTGAEGADAGRQA